VVLLAQGEKIIFQKAYGAADPQVGSLTDWTSISNRVGQQDITAAAIESWSGTESCATQIR